MMAADVAPRCVVAVMAKQPMPGRTKTRLSPPLSLKAAADLYEALLNDTIELVSGLHGLRLAVAVTPATTSSAWTPPAPPGAIVLTVEGADIGECLQQTTGQLCAAGFAHVMAINSDGPTLPASHIRQANALLEHHDVVVGPSEDGGYYLVGVRRPHPDLFNNIEWSTRGVLAQTLHRAAGLGLSVALLPAWYDVDTAADLERLRREVACLAPESLRWTRRFLAGRTAAFEGCRSRGLAGGGLHQEGISR